MNESFFADEVLLVVFGVESSHAREHLLRQDNRQPAIIKESNFIEHFSTFISLRLNAPDSQVLEEIF